MRHEVATCTCGNQTWKVRGYFIVCIECGAEHELVITGDMGEELETATIDIKETNSRIRRKK